jgi:dUTP pyrophosphatase
MEPRYRLVTTEEAKALYDFGNYDRLIYREDSEPVQYAIVSPGCSIFDIEEYEGGEWFWVDSDYGEENSSLSKVTLRIKKLNPSAVIPQYQHSTDSGMDLFYCGEPYELLPGERNLFECGIAIQLPPNTEAQVRSRSGLAHKNGVVVLNSPGTIDEGYQGEIKVNLINHSKDTLVINPGYRIAQMVICPVIRPEVLVVDDFATVTDRGENGHGSTGV